MTISSLQHQLPKQVEALPNDLTPEVAAYVDWTETAWRDFALENFIREIGDDVEYTLDDAQEVYQVRRRCF